MLKIGLTGGIGSGKTAVSKAFEQLNVPIIDTDIIAREVLDQSSLLDELVNTFGKTILDSNNNLIREELRGIAFQCTENKNKLDSIMHPAIRRATLKKMELIKNQSPHYCIIVVPLLIETNFIKLVDRVLVVTAELKRKLQWLEKRSQLSADNAKKIMSTQSSDEIKLSHADDHISNDSDLSNLITKVAELHKFYLTLPNKSNQ